MKVFVTGAECHCSRCKAGMAPIFFFFFSTFPSELIEIPPNQPKTSTDRQKELEPLLSL